MENLFFTLNRLIVVIILFVDLGLGVFVYLTDKKQRLYQLFFLISIFLFAWILAVYSGNTSYNPTAALILARIAYGVVALFFIPFYFFFLSFLKESKSYPTVNLLVALGMPILFIVSVFTPFMVVKMLHTSIGFIPLLGFGKYVYFGAAGLLSMFVAYLLINGYFRLSDEEKIKIQYFLTGILIFIVANFIFNIVLPLFQNEAQYYYLGNYSSIILLFFTAYAIIRHKLFDIKVIIVDVFVGILALLLVINIAVSQNNTYSYIGILIFILFLVFGWLLIKSVNTEVKIREQLQILAKQLEADNEKLKKLDEMKTDFVSMAAHQLRTPLTVIKGYLSMVLEGDYGGVQTGQQKDVLTKTMDSSDKLIGLVNDILDVTHLEGEGINYDFKKTNITDIVKDAAEGLQEKAQAKKLFITVTDPNFQGMVFADADKLRQVFINLIDNAIKYTKIGGVTILLHREIVQGAPYVVVGVQDTGLGFRTEDQNILFTKFGRTADAIHSSIEGSGLGLYIVKKIVTDHHGEIWAESAGVNQGATFWVRMREA